MQQAPASFTVPVNRVIQQTIEKIQQVEGKTITQTVVVKEEDLVVDAIAKNQSAVFVVSKETQDVDGKTIEVSAGKGFAISTDGIVVVDSSLVADKVNYYLKNDSGKFKADFVSVNTAGFSFLKIGAPVNGTDKSVFKVPAFGDLSKMKMGQKVLVLGSDISSFIFDGNKDIKMNVAKGDGGAAVLDLDGNVLGIALSGDTLHFASIDIINNALKGTTPATPTTP
jgi:hypothetical protein